MLDPGHGGSESGAVGPSGAQEKELTLALAQTLAARLQQRLAVRVVLTRTADASLPLDARTAIANQNKADLFISIHLNSSRGSGAHGAETYFLSAQATDPGAARSATAENAPELDAPDANTQPVAEDPLGDLQLILWDLAQTHHLAESQRFATLVQGELNQALQLRDRGVKQAPFRVLMGAAMPAVLVELGFLSTRTRRGSCRIRSTATELVEALVRAVVALQGAGREPAGGRRRADPGPRPTAALRSGAGGSPDARRSRPETADRRREPMSQRAARIVLALALLVVLGAALWWWLERREGTAAAGGPDAIPPGERIDITVDLYFATAGGLAPERRQIAATEDPKVQVRAIVQALLAGPRDGNLGRLFPEGVELGTVLLSGDGTAYVDLRQEDRPEPPSAGSTEEMQMVYGLVNSVALNVPRVPRVVLLWNGAQRTTFAGHLDTSRPLEPDRALLSR